MTGEDTKEGLPFGHVVVVGGGLMGSSLLRASRRVWGRDVKLTVCDRDEEVLRYYSGGGGGEDCVDEVWHIDDVKGREGRGEGVDLIMLAVPLGVYGEVLEKLGVYLCEGVVVSDVGSGKRTVSEVFRGLPEGCYGVPGHPVAGTEKSGPRAGMGDLFLDRHCVLTPLEREDEGYKGACARVEIFWRSLGMSVTSMTAEHHDLVLAMTSHLPTLVSYCMVGTAKGLEGLDWKCQHFADGREVKEGFGGIDTLEVMRYAAGGFRDFTRLAASDPVMWRDVYLHNKSPVLFVLDLFLEDVKRLREAVVKGEGDFLESYFVRSQGIRRGIVEMRQAGQFEPKEGGVSLEGEERDRKEKGDL